jgi:hypothetical protein
MGLGLVVIVLVFVFEGCAGAFFEDDDRDFEEFGLGWGEVGLGDEVEAVAVGEGGDREGDFGFEVGLGVVGIAAGHGFVPVG